MADDFAVLDYTRIFVKRAAILVIRLSPSQSRPRPLYSAPVKVKVKLSLDLTKLAQRHEGV
jgi:hypothetical protein